MASSITLYRNTSDKNKLNKTLTQIAGPMNVLVKDMINGENPVIELKGGNYAGCNYAMLDGIYYFVETPTKDNAQRNILNLYIDPLMTYKSAIKACDCVITRQQQSANSNKYINDGSLVTESKCENVLLESTQKFDNTTCSYVLTVVGKGVNER